MAISIDKLYDDVCQKSWDLLGECKAPIGNASPAWHFFFQRVLLRLELWGDDLGWNNNAFDPAKVQSLSDDNLPLILSAIGEKLKKCETLFNLGTEDLEETEKAQSELRMALGDLPSSNTAIQSPKPQGADASGAAQHSDNPSHSPASMTGSKRVFDDEYLRRQIRRSIPATQTDSKILVLPSSSPSRTNSLLSLSSSICNNDLGSTIANDYQKHIVAFCSLFKDAKEAVKPETWKESIYYEHEDFLEAMSSNSDLKPPLPPQGQNSQLLNQLQQITRQLHDRLWFLTLAISNLLDAGGHRRTFASELVWTLFTSIILRLRTKEVSQRSKVYNTLKRLAFAFPTTTAYPHHCLGHDSTSLDEEIASMYGFTVQIGFNIFRDVEGQSELESTAENNSAQLFEELTGCSRKVDHFTLKAYIRTHVEEPSTLRHAPEFESKDAGAEVNIETAGDITWEQERIFDVPSQLLTKHFRGRENDLIDIAGSYFINNDGRTSFHIVSGLEGMGKTQLVLEFTSFLYELSPNHHCLWLCAASPDHLRRGIEAIRRELDIQDVIFPDFESQVIAIKERLSTLSAENQPWTLVVDAFRENEEVESRLYELLPQVAGNGHVIFTVRDQYLDRLKSLTGSQLRYTHLGVLSPEHATHVLLSAAHFDAAPMSASMAKCAEEIVTYLACFPIAVKRAGAYLKRSENPDSLINLESFLNLLKGVETADATSIYHEQSRQIGEAEGFDLPDHLSKALAVTLHITLDRISTSPHVQVRSLLQVLAFLDSENIPFGTLLEALTEEEGFQRPASFSHLTVSERRINRPRSRGRESMPPLRTQEDSGIELARHALHDPSSTLGLLSRSGNQEDLIKDLLSTSLVGRRSARQIPSLRMHDRVMEMLLQNMDRKTRQTAYCQAVELVAKAFEPLVDRLDRSSTWRGCDVLAPHFKSLIEKGSVYHLECFRFWRAYLDFGQFLSIRGNYEEAKECYELCLEQFTKPSEPKIAEEHTARYRLARVLMRQARHEDAMKEIVKILRVHRDGDYPQISNDNLDDVELLARCYYAQGHFEKAEPIYNQIYAIKKRSIVDDDESGIADILEGISNIRQRRGDNLRAAEMYSQVVALKKQELGAKYLSLQRARFNQARLLRDQGKMKKAIRELKSIRDNIADVLGFNHPETQRIVCRLAFAYAHYEKPDKAEKYASRVEQLFENEPSHYAIVGLSRTVLATVAKQKGHFEDAANILARVVEIYEPQLGHVHPTTLYVKCEYSDALQKCQRFSDAIKVLEDIPPLSREGAVDTRLAVLYDYKAQHSQDKLENHQLALKAYQVAKDNHNRLKAKQGTYEVDSVEVNNSLWALGRISLHNRFFSQAVTYYESAERGWRRMPRAMFGDLKSLTSELLLARKVRDDPHHAEDFLRTAREDNQKYVSLDPDPPMISDFLEGYLPPDPFKTVTSEFGDEDLMAGTTLSDESRPPSIFDNHWGV